MKATSSIVAGGRSARLFVAGMALAAALSFWFIFAGERDFFVSEVLPLPGIVTLVAFVAIVARKHRTWSRRLTPTALEHLGDGDYAIDGVVRSLDGSLVSPYTGRTCVAWRGWFIGLGEGYDEHARAVPFVIELPDGSAVVIRFGEVVVLPSHGPSVPPWNHLGHDEEIVRQKNAPPLSDEDLARARDFLGRRASKLAPEREVAYADGDRVVLAGTFRRMEDSATYRSIKGLPIYEVSGDVVFAKGPASLHRRVLSPWLRAYGPLCLAVACGVEVMAHFLLLVPTLWLAMTR